MTLYTDGAVLRSRREAPIPVLRHHVNSFARSLFNTRFIDHGTITRLWNSKTVVTRSGKPCLFRDQDFLHGFGGRFAECRA